MAVTAFILVSISGSMESLPMPGTGHSCLVRSWYPGLVLLAVAVSGRSIDPGPSARWPSVRWPLLPLPPHLFGVCAPLLFGALTFSVSFPGWCCRQRSGWRQLLVLLAL